MVNPFDVMGELYPSRLARLAALLPFSPHYLRGYNGA
jgi:hypothetical protein